YCNCSRFTSDQLSLGAYIVSPYLEQVAPCLGLALWSSVRFRERRHLAGFYFLRAIPVRRN
ncbi:MAG: hypothetical protein K2X77_22820, partial [Candidatus Obscuribacterales bacterium]|nr:hypothetical protein [Candidatus Obscuribacterales bacterium]